MTEKILLIGAGRWGMNHVRTWRTLGVDLHVADASDAVLDKCHALGVPRDRLGKNHRDFLPLVDAVDVVTPAPSHHALCLEALDLDKDLFVEKPLALSSPESEDIVRRAAGKKRILQVGHIFRYEPPTRHVKQLIESGELGDVHWMRGNFSGFKRPRNDSGVTFADAIHFADLFNHLLGRLPVSVNARLLDALGRGMDDNAWLWLDYGRVFASIEVGYFTPLKTREVVIVGSRKSVVVDYTVQQDKVKIYSSHHEKKNGDWVALEGDVRTVEFDPEEPLLIELRAFIESIRTRKPPLADGQGAAEAVRVIEAALESSRRNAPVPI